MRPHNTFLVAGLLLAILLLTLTSFNFSPVQVEAQTNASTALQQNTPTPSVQNGSEIGSTDGILIMGVIIVVIVILPLFFYKRK